ncbi:MULTISPECIES: UDP-N-acetylmuramate dehydrogenase [Pseudarthrobacter]|uniref:UDP-N-acetylenolpyruvoylglucosamine reductase n=1 Tax=Pseudarthrobacter niigatensis TaxID=369935 RepID=A0AAJ1WGV3_9MICC|nr:MULTISPECIES: UDP-N-acetylmuramate dehydrogenase [Pseudarthrobacter]MDQ0147205.1 UDP-N-acetylmuramate dehydrogenase [Pseudarthrobacter niigatensis]MDQ0266934.1 UDP-N-acetylmuramate dehydrogenase [Pseudarthrobacter niigatensis]QDG62724.1 UDP-N-acetylmuramate dehydrogenase [Pseudarthrobacter sp. NIBRBAC000502771]
MTSTLLSALTTSAVGGPAGKYVEARTEAEIINAVSSADAAGEQVLIVSGGSNLLVSDDGFPGTVIRIASEGFTVNAEDSCGGVAVVVQAGHNWDKLVEHAVLHAWSGIEALSGIPGSTGATPVQNVGAYGADVSQTIAAVRTWDRERNAVQTFTNSELKFGYRDSILKQATVNGSPRYVVLTVEFQLPLGRMSAPIRYAELARALGVEVGQRAYANDVRREVLRLRASKGMVWDAADRDTYSTGSFFTNPIVAADVADKLPENAPRYPAGQDGMVKLSAAWLIDQAGFGKGFGLEDGGVAGGRASLSTKHTLAITNRGSASAADMVAVAREVRAGVERHFGISLHPEPLLIGLEL